MTGCAEKTNEPQPITFYLIRHGETMFNERGLAQGWCDAPLTEEGIAQAEDLGKGLADVPFTAAYSSVSERAMDTGNAVIAGRDISLQLTEDLKEMNFGTMEGEPNSVLWAAGMDKRLKDGWTDVGGENFDILGDRVLKALDEAVEANKATGGNILISSHGMSIMAVLQKIDMDAFNDFMATGAQGLDNCSVTIVEYNDGTYTVKTINDTSYRDNGAAK